jgi:hypothetical protein
MMTDCPFDAREKRYRNREWAVMSGRPRESSSTYVGCVAQTNVDKKTSEEADRVRQRHKSNAPTSTLEICTYLGAKGRAASHR